MMSIVNGQEFGVRKERKVWTKQKEFVWVKRGIDGGGRRVYHGIRGDVLHGTIDVFLPE